MIVMLSELHVWLIHKKGKKKKKEKKKNYLSKTWGHNLALYNYEQTMSWIQFLPHVIKFCAFTVAP